MDFVFGEDTPSVLHCGDTGLKEFCYDIPESEDDTFTKPYNLTFAIDATIESLTTTVVAKAKVAVTNAVPGSTNGETTVRTKTVWTTNTYDLGKAQLSVGTNITFTVLDAKAKGTPQDYAAENLVAASTLKTSETWYWQDDDTEATLRSAPLNSGKSASLTFTAPTNDWLSAAFDGADAAQLVFKLSSASSNIVHTFSAIEIATNEIENIVVSTNYIPRQKTTPTTFAWITNTGPKTIEYPASTTRHCQIYSGEDAAGIDVVCLTNVFWQFDGSDFFAFDFASNLLVSVAQSALYRAETGWSMQELSLATNGFYETITTNMALWKEENGERLFKYTDITTNHIPIVRPNIAFVKDDTPISWIYYDTEESATSKTILVKKAQAVLGGTNSVLQDAKWYPSGNGFSCIDNSTGEEFHFDDVPQWESETERFVLAMACQTNYVSVVKTNLIWSASGVS